MAVNLLRIMRQRYTYRALSEKTGLPITVLNRYVRGRVLPTEERAKKIWDTFSGITTLEKEIWSRIKFDNSGYFDNTRVIFDIALLQQVSFHLLYKFAGKRITKVMTAATDGIPFATIVASTFGVDLVVAKKEKEVGVHEFLEETYIPGNSGIVVSLFAPKDAIKRNDSVLIADDVIRSGETQRALIRLVKKAKATVAGISALIAIGDEWKKKITEDIPIEIICKADQLQNH